MNARTCEHMTHELVTEEARRGPDDSEQPNEEPSLGPLTVRAVSVLNHRGGLRPHIHTILTTLRCLFNSVKKVDVSSTFKWPLLHFSDQLVPC